MLIDFLLKNMLQRKRCECSSLSVREYNFGRWTRTMDKGSTFQKRFYSLRSNLGCDLSSQLINWVDQEWKKGRNDKRLTAHHVRCERLTARRYVVGVFRR